MTSGLHPEDWKFESFCPHMTKGKQRMINRSIALKRWKRRNECASDRDKIIFKTGFNMGWKARKKRIDKDDSLIEIELTADYFKDVWYIIEVIVWDRLKY